MISVMISIQPKWCELIASGKKTIEVRKTKPKIETPFKCYIYCTNIKTLGDFILCKSEENANLFGYNTAIGINKGFAKAEDVQLKGKVIGEFMCDYIVGHCEMANADIAEQRGCVKREELFEFANGKEIYGWHISDLVIYDRPKELSEFYALDNDAVQKCEHREQTYYSFTDTGYIKNGMYCRCKDDWCIKCKRKAITRPPQSWCYIEEKR